MTATKNMIEIFGINAMIAKEKGLSVQECININKQASVLLFGMSETEAEKIVLKWIESCKETGLMN